MHIQVESQVLDFLTLKKMNEIAKGIGYNLNGDFLQGEFDSLVLEATDLVLKHLRSISYINSLPKKIEQTVQSSVKEQFEKVCMFKRIPVFQN